MTTKTPAGRLVSAFGDVARMRALYAPNVEWSLPASLPFPRPMRGYDAVVAFNVAVWAEHYHPDCAVTLLDETGDERFSAVRFIYRARLRSTGAQYENEYCLFVRAGANGIEAVFEMPDTLAIFEIMTNTGIGDTMLKLGAGSLPVVEASGQT